MAAFHQWTVEGNAQALDNFYRAIELDPEFANAYGMAARCVNQRLVTQPLTVGAVEVAEAERLARRAADLGRNDAMALCMAGLTLGFAVKDVRGGAALTARALALNPNLAWAWYSDGWLNVWLGNPDIGIARIGRAMELSPQDPMIFQMQTAMAHAHFTAGDDSQAWSWAQKALHDRPDHFPALLAAAASAVYLGRQTEAEDAKSRLLKIIPGIDLSYLTTLLPYQQHQDAARWSEGLRKAGLPGD
jgi:tetratricopeptide (TPR) repeat protein